MATLAEEAYRQRLESYDRLLERWMKALREEAEHVDPAQLGRLIKTAKILAQRLNANLPPTIGAHATAEIRGILLDGYQWLEEEKERPPLDVLNDLLIRSEAIRHIVRDALDEDLGPVARTRHSLVSRLEEWLPDVKVHELAELLGVDVRTVQRWRSSVQLAPRRLVLVARLVKILHLSWTTEGVVAWFRRSRRELDGRSPLECIDDPAREQALFAIARQGSAQHGT